MKKILLVLSIVTTGASVNAQSVYTCNSTNVNVRENNCTTASSFGQVNSPQSYVVINTTGTNCGYTWYQIDIPSAHGQSGYPTTAYVATNYFSTSGSPNNYLTVQNASSGLLIKNSVNGSQTWIYNSGYNFNYASFENGQKLARTSSSPVTSGNDTWYEVYLTPNCYANSYTSSGVMLTGWVSNGISSGGPYVIPYGCTSVTVSSWPADQTVTAPGSASFSLNASGTSPTYQWQYSTNSGNTWNPVPNGSPYSGITSYSLSIYPTSTSMSGYKYRCMIGGNCTTTFYSNWVTLTVNSSGNAPVASFSASPTSGNTPLTVYFTDLSSNSPTSWYWDFGDSYSSSSQNPSHTYSNAGNYAVSLTATNTYGNNTSTQSNYIYVSTGGSSPVANFSASPTSGTAPLNVSFYDQSSNSPTSWSWNFGDGYTSSTQNPSHTYSSAGTYSVTLTATNSNGNNALTKSNYIYVSSGGSAPVASFSASPTSGNAPLTVYFTDLSSNSPTSWYWDFGDGLTSSLQNPSHTYSSAGTYTVTLTSTNTYGSDSYTESNYIYVSSSGNAPVANFYGSPTSITVGNSVNFYDVSNNSPTSWSWSFPGGTPSSSSAQNPINIVYNTAGSYNVTLTAANPYGSNAAIVYNYIVVNTSPTYSIYGTAKDAIVNVTTGNIDLTPFSNCIVKLYSAGSNTVLQSYTTGSNGVFMFNGLASGSYYDVKVEYFGSQNFSVKKYNIPAGTNMGDVAIPQSMNLQITNLINDLENLNCYLTEVGQTIYLQSYDLSSVQNLLYQWQNQTANYSNIINSTGRLFLVNKTLKKFFDNAGLMNDQMATNILELSKSFFSFLTISAKLQQLINNSSFPYGYQLLLDLIDATKDIFVDMASAMTGLIPSPYGQEFDAAILSSFAIATGQLDEFDLVVNLVEEPIAELTTNHYLGNNYVYPTQYLILQSANKAASFNYSGTFNNDFNTVYSSISTCDYLTNNDVDNCNFHRNISNVSQLVSSVSAATSLVLNATGVGTALAVPLQTIATVASAFSIAEIGVSSYYSLHRLYRIQVDLSPTVSQAFKMAPKSFNIFNSSNFQPTIQSIDSAAIAYNSLLQEIINDVNADNISSALSKTHSLFLLDSILRFSINESLNQINAAAPIADSLFPDFAIEYYDTLVNTLSIAPTTKLSLYHSLVAYMIDSTNSSIVSDINSYGNQLINANLQIPIELNSIYNTISSLPTAAYIASTFDDFPEFLNNSSNKNVTVKFKNYGSSDASNLYVKVMLDNGYSSNIDSFYIGTLSVNSIDSISFNVQSPVSDTFGIYNITFHSDNSFAKPLVGVILPTTKTITNDKKPDNTLSNGIIIYPNPTLGKFQLEVLSTRTARVKIHNTIGEVIYQRELTNPRYEIDLSKEPNGVYFIQVQTEKGIYNQKLLIQ